MAIKDINEIYQQYIEGNKYRAFLYTPANVFAGELDLISPQLSLKKDGFDLLDFSLSAKLFDLNTLQLEDNPFIDFTLDGYYVVMQFGDLTSNDYEERRFIIKNRNSNLQDEAASFSYIAISAEYELQKLPIINWPGIQVEEYKDITPVIESRFEELDPVLLDGSVTGFDPIELRHEPKEGKIFVSRIHTTYQIEIPLFETSVPSDQLENMGANEYYYDREENKIITWLPAHISLPVSPAGEVNFNDPVDSYQFFIYYQTEDEITEQDIIEGSFEKAYFYNTDGLTINQILEDVFQILSTEDSNLRFFTQWTYKAESIQSPEIRSDLNFSNTTVYEMLKSLEENYQLYIEFDTMNREVILKERFSGENRGLRFEYGKYLEGVSQEYNTDDIVTYLQGQDANNIGFADVSWSGDNYVENYDYYLDGVTWEPEEGNPDGKLTGASRWITADLARVLGKIKYYQELYEAEVWGDETKEGIANIRFDLQQELNEIDVEILELEKEIEIKEGVLESYENEDPLQKVALNAGVKRNPANVLIDKIIEGETFAFENLNLVVNTTQCSVPPTNTCRVAESQIIQINGGQSVKFRNFKIQGLFSDNSIEDALTERDGQPQTPITNIRVKFFDEEDELVQETFLTFKDIDKEIPLNTTVEAVKFQIRVSIENDRGRTNFLPGQTFELSSVSFFEADEILSVYTWENYSEYITSIIEDLKGKKTTLEIKQNLIKNGTVIGFDAEQPIDESHIFGRTPNDNEAIGIGQIELRLDYMRTFTSVDHESLSENVLNELKSIRKGAVYSNNDIRNSKTLFIAARNELKEKIYPMITIDISSVSILQTYEAFEDWKKFKIGEKVDIFVPELKINIEAEIQELDFDFQNYQTSVKISTVRNYDKTFGRIFSNTFLLAKKTSENEVERYANFLKAQQEFFDKYGVTIEDAFSERDPISVGYEDIVTFNPQESTRVVFQPDARPPKDIGFNSFEAVNAYIDLATDTLTYEEQVYYYEYQQPKSTVKITNGGLYLKNEDNEVKIKMNYSDGFVGYNNNNQETFRIDLDGNAIFAGELQAATGTFSGTLSVGVALTDPTLNNLIDTLQDQIDGAISTFFAEGIPLPKDTTYTGTTQPSSPQEGQTWFDGTNYFIFLFGNWEPTTANIQIDVLEPWPTDSVEFYQVHLGDLYFDTETGYAYRFAKTGTAVPDVVANYKWVQISDGAATAALAAASTAQATADGKMTYFTASSSGSLDSALASTPPKDGDILTPSATFTHTTPTPNVTYILNTVYIYSESDGYFKPEEKADGSVGGWTITSDQIKSNNNKIILDNSTTKITVGSNSGTVTLDGAATGTQPVLNHSKFQLKADGSASFSGGLSAATGTFSGDLQAAGGTFSNVSIENNGGLSINQSDVGYDNAGIFLGIENEQEKFSIKDTMNENFLKWDGSGLSVKGDLLLENSVYQTISNTENSVLIISNIDYNGSNDDFETDFGTGSGLSIETDKYETVVEPTYAWQSLINYIGIAEAVDTLPTPSAQFLGTIYYLTTDQTYYQGIQTSGSGFIEVTIGESLVVQQLPIFESGTTTKQYRGQRTKFSHTFPSNRIVTFDMSFNFTPNLNDFEFKTVYIFYQKEDKIENIFNIFLESQAVGSIVNSINGQTGDVEIVTGGSVTSVGLALPTDIFTISNTPVTTAGTLTATLNEQTQKKVFAAPSSATGTPTFRELVATDLPTHSHEIENITNLQSSLDAKANLASPAFTGVPTAPTASTATNSIQIATTQYVKNVVAEIAGGLNFKGTIDLSGAGKTGNDLRSAGLLASGDYLIVSNTGNIIDGGAVTLIVQPPGDEGDSTLPVTLETGDWILFQSYVEPDLKVILLNNNDGSKAPLVHTHSAADITSGTLSVSRGGTGSTTFTSGEVLIGNGTGGVTTLSRDSIDSRSTFPASDHTLSSHSDVSTTSPSSGQVLKWNGTAWAPATDENTTYAEATSTVLGLVKIGYSQNAKNYPIQLSSGQMFVNIPWTDTWKANTNLQEGYVASGENQVNKVWKTDNLGNPAWRDDAVGPTYNTATTSTSGIVRLGVTAANQTVNTASTTAGRFYPVGASINGNLYVNVPWVDTNTTYDPFEGATAMSNGFSGLVPAPTSDDRDKFLKGDGTWAFTPNTVTRLRGTTSGTFVSGDITIAAGSNTTVSQSSNTITIASTDTVYTHPTGGANTTITAANGLVLSAITVNNLGHVSSVSSKTLAAEDIPDLFVKNSGDTMSGQLLMNAVNPGAQASDSQQILFRSAQLQNNVDKVLKTNSDGFLLFDNNTIYHTGNLTNLNQLTNGPGYVTSSGVTSVEAGSGLTGGTITSTGTIAVDSTVVRTTSNQTIGGVKTFSNNSIFNGSVGIGTTSPATKLHVAGSATATDGLLLVNNTHSAGGTPYPALRVLNDRGNHSYGIVSEFRITNTSDADRPAILFSKGGTNNNWAVGMGVYGNANDNFSIGYRSAYPMNAFATSRLTINTSGDVGIGTNSPDEKLEVIGNIKATYFKSNEARFYGDGGDNAVVAADKGAVEYIFGANGILQAPTGFSGAIQETNNDVGISIWVGTQAQYDNIGTKSATTLYFIT